MHMNVRGFTPFHCAALLLALSAPAQALTRHVWTNSPSPGAPFTNWTTAAHSITAATAVASAGDVVLVTNGVYQDANTFVITNAITLRSVNGWTNTVLDHMGYVGRVVGPLPAGATVEGFTLVGGAGTEGGGIYVGSGAELRSSLVMSNRGVRGGGIYGGPGSLITGCIVRANYVYTGGGYKGGGIYCVTGLVKDCAIELNSAYQGGGIFCVGGVIERCIIRTNSAYWGGGASEGYGGGVFFDGGGTADLCRVEGNGVSGAYRYGGGVYFQGGGVLRNSLVTRHSANYGGGVFANGGGSIESCTIAGNSVASYGYGGGVYCAGASLLNTIISGNSGGDYPDVYFSDGSADHCCSPSYLWGTDNIMDDPRFIYPEGGDFRLSPLSLCKNTGSYRAWMIGARDLDGRDRILDSIVDRGAYETPFSCNFSGSPRVGTVPMTVVFTGEVAGAVSGVHFQWDFEDDGTWDRAGTGLAVVTNVYTNIALYSVRLAVSNTVGATASVAKARYIGAYPSEVFVSTNGFHQPPFTNWVTAATNIQAAANQGLAGTVVWVSNGTYVLTSEVTVPRDVVVRSVNGFSNTVVDGSAGTWRCFSLTSSGAVVRGFTIRRGNAGGSGGGGVYAGPHTRVHDCLITNNAARTRGGGVEFGPGAVVSNCVITGNTVGDTDGGGGAFGDGGEIVDCIVSDNTSVSPYGGAGVYCQNGTMIRRCLITRNRSGYSTGWQQGAGVWLQGGTLENCTVSLNQCPAYYAGGGVMCFAGGVVTGCTVRANTGYECGGIYLNGGTVANSLVEENTGSTYHAGGIYLKSGNVENCIVRSNSALYAGAGVSILNGTVRNCLIVDNASGKDQIGSGGGGVYCQGAGTLENCTISRNSANSGGGIHCIVNAALDVRNSIIYGNSADTWDNCFIGTNVTFLATCTEPIQPGMLNTDEDPNFGAPESGDFRLLPGSPCMDGGTNESWMDSATDLDGNSRIVNGAVDMGAYESFTGPLTGNAIADVVDGTGPRKVVFEAFASGTNTASLFYSWDFNGDGTADLQGYGLRVVTNLYDAFGRFDFALTVSNAVGQSYTVSKPEYIKVGPAIAYVRRASGSPAYPFTNWVMAATNIQTAVDAGEEGTLVVVTDGTYRVTSPLVLRKGVTVRSVHGFALTALDGAGGTNRCVELRHPRAVVDGFTIKNGFASGQNGLAGAGAFLFGGGEIRNSTIVSNTTDNYGSGGGVACFFGGRLSNCVVSYNYSSDEGGGMRLHGGPSAAEGCVIERNSSYGHGAGVSMGMGALLKRGVIRANESSGQGGGINVWDGGVVEDCLIESNRAMSGYSGGGVANNYMPATIDRCIVRGNACSGYGGGVALFGGGNLQNCTIYSNEAGYAGGGVALYAGCALQNCTVIGNSTPNYGGGVWREGAVTVRNSILYFNTGGTGSNYFENGHVETWFNNCVAPIPGGTNNISAEPQLGPLTGGVWRLSSSSPCIDAGDTNDAPAFDVENIARPLDGNADGTAATDMGASEYASTNVDADADGLSDAAEAYVWHTGALISDSDGDRTLDGPETRAGTDPLSASSYLGVESTARASGGGNVIRWRSVDGKRYALSRATNLVAGYWSPVTTNILGVAPMNTVTDTTAIGSGPWAYRVQVE
jgi:hypothetical protein